MIAPPRALVVAPPGWGKTRLLREVMHRWQGPGLLIDPIGDVGATPGRMSGMWTLHTAREAGEAIIEQPRGALVLIDEAPRLIAPSARIAKDPFLYVLDVARNLGLGFVLATKHATMLPPTITQLCDRVVYGPTRTPAVRRWLEAAGLDADIDIPPRSWAYALGDETVILSADETAMRLAGQLEGACR